MFEAFFLPLIKSVNAQSPMNPPPKSFVQTDPSNVQTHTNTNAINRTLFHTNTPAHGWEVAQAWWLKALSRKLYLEFGLMLSQVTFSHGIPWQGRYYPISVEMNADVFDVLLKLVAMSVTLKAERVWHELSVSLSLPTTVVVHWRALSRPLAL